MADSRWHSFWFAFGEHPCHVTMVSSDSEAAAIRAAQEAYAYLSTHHGRFDLNELRLVQGTSEPLHAQDI